MSEPNEELALWEKITAALCACILLSVMSFLVCGFILLLQWTFGR
jgi:hypothetical protein